MAYVERNEGGGQVKRHKTSIRCEIVRDVRLYDEKGVGKLEKENFIFFGTVFPKDLQSFLKDRCNIASVFLQKNVKYSKLRHLIAKRNL